MALPLVPLLFEGFPARAFRLCPSLSSVNGENGNRMRQERHSVSGGHDIAFPSGDGVKDIPPGPYTLFSGSCCSTGTGDFFQEAGLSKLAFASAVSNPTQ